jgi:hypothetical protein
MCKKIIENIILKYSFLNFYVYFNENKVLSIFKNNIFDFKSQHLFFKNKFENTIIFLDVNLFFRVLSDDALFINNYFMSNLKKTNNYVFVDIYKKNYLFIINKLITKNKNIIVTTQVNEGNLVYRQILSFYFLNKNI